MRACVWQLPCMTRANQGGEEPEVGDACVFVTAHDHCNLCRVPTYLLTEWLHDPGKLCGCGRLHACCRCLPRLAEPSRPRRAACRQALVGTRYMPHNRSLAMRPSVVDGDRALRRTLLTAGSLACKRTKAPGAKCMRTRTRAPLDPHARCTTPGGASNTLTPAQVWDPSASQLHHSSPSPRARGLTTLGSQRASRHTLLSYAHRRIAKYA